MAIKWYKKALEYDPIGMAYVATFLGEYYYEGKAVARNLQEALKYYQHRYKYEHDEKSKEMIDKINLELSQQNRPAGQIGVAATPVRTPIKNDIEAVCTELEKQARYMLLCTGASLDVRYSLPFMVRGEPISNSYYPYVTFKFSFHHCSDLRFLDNANAYITSSTQQYYDKLNKSGLTSSDVRGFDTKDKRWSNDVRDGMSSLQYGLNRAEQNDKLSSQFRAEKYYTAEAEKEAKLRWDIFNLGRSIVVATGTIENPTGNKLFHKYTTEQVECVVKDYKVKCYFHFDD
jgi:TPR repeat protein